MISITCFISYLTAVFSTISFKESNENYTNVYPDWYSLMDYIQGINMKSLSFKALLTALLTITLLFTSTVVSAAPKVTTSAVVKQQVVHLNKSTIDDLVTLKGVGYKKAQAIIAYREQVGGFKSVNELMKVKGIGEKILIDNKERLKI